jgi:alkaline phosphatase D
MLIDVNPNRVVGEWWFVDMVTAPSANEAFATAFPVETRTNRLGPASQTPSRPGAAPLAP